MSKGLMHRADAVLAQSFRDYQPIASQGGVRPRIPCSVIHMSIHSGRLSKVVRKVNGGDSSHWSRKQEAKGRKAVISCGGELIADK